MLHAYLGTLLAAKFQADAALECLSAARKHGSGDPVVYRNLGEVYWHERNDLSQAASCYEEAVARDPNDASYYVALDCLYALQKEQAKREKLFAEAPAAVRANDRVLRKPSVVRLISFGRIRSFARKPSRRLPTNVVEERLGDAKPALGRFLRAGDRFARWPLGSKSP